MCILHRLLIVPVVLTSGLTADAHEIGTTRVTALFEQQRTYNIEIVTDAVTLVEKLEVLSGSQPSAETHPARLQSLLVTYSEKFRQRVKVAFDGLEAHSVATYSVSQGSGPGSDAIATIRLTGEIPRGAQRFTWTYLWTFASYSLKVQNGSTEKPVTEWLEGGQASAPFALTVTPTPLLWTNTAWRYLKLGFTHILPNGLDHMLFVLGIYLLSGRARSVFWQVSAFTAAHSITLGLSMYGVIAVPPGIVEPLIALSIAYVAIENIFLAELRSWRIALVFAFGLLHGMGFAGALKEVGLPRSEFVTALFTFNVGVEVAQLSVIGAAFILIGWHCSNRNWYRSCVVVPVSALIACTAVYWTAVRLLA